jgi:hypothetical protein
VSISLAVDNEGQVEEIESLAFRNDAFLYVTLHPYEGYKEQTAMLSVFVPYRPIHRGPSLPKKLGVRFH